MYIVFNGMNAGFSNNGGSRTIFKCAEVLRNLGHKVDVCARVNNFTWFDVVPTLNYIPEDADVIINSSCHDMSSTLSSKIKKKYWYIRGHETWAMSEDMLIKHYLNPKVENLVNSKGLQKQLKSYGAESSVIYQGVDLDLWRDLRIRDKNFKTKIGCLYHKKLSKKWSDFVYLSKLLGDKDFEYVAFGNDVCTDTFLSEFKHRPSQYELSELYSSCDIWMAPTCVEGLHNVGMEASLSGALIVCNDVPLNGMIYDYAFSDTAMIYKFDDIKHAADLIRNPHYDYVENMQEVIINTINSREYNMKKLLNIIEKNL